MKKQRRSTIQAARAYYCLPATSCVSLRYGFQRPDDAAHGSLLLSLLSLCVLWRGEAEYLAAQGKPRFSEPTASENGRWVFHF
jgi:hypothetical protein